MYPSRPRLRSASTVGGMRRILKRLPSPPDFIRKAVRSGIYYKDPKTNIRKSPWGTQIQDYPKDYEILTMHPPIPDRPRLPKKLLPKQRTLPTQRLARKYLQSMEDEELTADSYWRKLLGISKHQSSQSLRPSQVNKAYAVAVKQFELMRTHLMTEDEALEEVERLLQDVSSNEVVQSRKVQKDIQKEEQVHKETTTETEGESTSPFIPSVVNNRPRVLEGMSLWSKRLEVIPYEEWTVGAASALDNWIALSVLGLSKQSWLELLESQTPELQTVAHDITQVRHALFPETIRRESVLPTPEESPSSSQRIDELLASLGALGDDDEETQQQQEDLEDVDELVRELQDWRSEHQSTPFEKWSKERKEEFQEWLQHYVSSLTNETNVDWDATREALLAVPPLSKESSDAFWHGLKDMEWLHEWLDTLQEGPFSELPRSVQISQLLELSALEPLLNEYTPESEKREFLQKHSSKLLAELELPFLVEGKRIDHSELLDEDEGTYDIVQEKAPKTDIYKQYAKAKSSRAMYEQTMFQQGKLGLKYGENVEEKEEEEDE